MPQSGRNRLVLLLVSEDEARERMLQSQRLLREGNAYLAKLAANIAVDLDPCPATTRNRDTIHSTTAPWNEEAHPAGQAFPLREAAELHVRRSRIAFVKLVSYIPEAYRVRVAASMFILGLAIILRGLYGGALPLKWLLTGAYYNKTNEDGASFTFILSPSVGWLLLSVLIRFFLHRPEPRRRAHVD